MNQPRDQRSQTIQVIFASLSIAITAIILFVILILIIDTILTTEDDATSTPASVILSTPTSVVLHTPHPECIFRPERERPILSGSSVDFSVSILSPQPCDSIPRLETLIELTGVYEGDLNRYTLWVLVYAFGDRLFYPQSINACRGELIEYTENRWQTFVRFPDHESGSRVFEIVVAATPVDSLASQTFEDWFADGCDTGRYPGFKFDVDDDRPFPALPEGLTELSSVMVRKRYGPRE